MKMKKTATIVGITISMISMQGWSNEFRHPGEFYDDHHHEFYHGHHGPEYDPQPEPEDHHHLSNGQAIAVAAVGVATIAALTCSPDTVMKNTQSVEQRLDVLSKGQLKDRDLFTQKVEDIKKMSSEQKVDEAFRMVGIVNPRDSKEILSVVYAREPSKVSISRVSENLKLSDQESRLVIQSVVGALKQR